MSLHPSLKVDAAGAQKRNILTRIERIKDLMKKGLWKDGGAVIALPKIKIIKLKAKKRVAKKEEEGAAAGGAAAPAAAAAPAGKAAAKPAAK